jgi:hypothetical protein
MIGACLKANTEAVQERFAALAAPLVWTQSHAWILLPALALVAGASQVVRRTVGEPWLWDVIHSLLDDLQKQAFGDVPSEPLHHHRATLFKHVKWKACSSHWPGSGWLIPVERSGHTARKTKAFFHAPDDADNAEGVAGKTWACGGVLFVSGLPDPRTNLKKKQRETYIRETWVSERWFERRDCYARSFCGIPVEARGQPWGVIVLDSRNEKEIGKEAANYYNLIAKQLGLLLGRR